MPKPKNPSQKNRVLTDHKQVGKTLIPPLMQLPGGISSTYFDRDTMPELVWLALLEKAHGLKTAANIASTIGSYIQNTKSSNRFISLSEMHTVTAAEWKELRAYLKTSGVLPDLLTAIHDFVVLYPECPLASLFEQSPCALRDDQYLAFVENLIGELMHKRGRSAVFMQANALYLLGCQGKLFINAGLSLGNLEALANYPETEESKKVGASVCASSAMLLMMRDKKCDEWSWPQYFWTRNLELKPITIFDTNE
jgi:hypothetical protein